MLKWTIFNIQVSSAHPSSNECCKICWLVLVIFILIYFSLTKCLGIVISLSSIKHLLFCEDVAMVSSKLSMGPRCTHSIPGTSRELSNLLAFWGLLPLWLQMREAAFRKMDTTLLSCLGTAKRRRKMWMCMNVQHQIIPQSDLSLCAFLRRTKWCSILGINFEVNIDICSHFQVRLGWVDHP